MSLKTMSHNPGPFYHYQRYEGGEWVLVQRGKSFLAYDSPEEALGEFDHLVRMSYLNSRQEYRIVNSAWIPTHVYNPRDGIWRRATSEEAQNAKLEERSPYKLFQTVRMYGSNGPAYYITAVRAKNRGFEYQLDEGQEWYPTLDLEPA